MFDFLNVTYQEVLYVPELHIGRGMTVLVGASGSGKTTLLRLLNKSISPTSGQIMYNGMELQQIPSVKLRREVLMLSQQPAIFAGDIKDNLAIGFKFQNRETPSDQVMLAMLEQVHLDKKLDTPVHLLSGGEKQRLALGRVFLLQPDVYLLDEPSSALDRDTEDSVISLVVEQARSAGQSIIMVTHSHAVAEKFAEVTIEFAKGKVLVRGAKT